MIDINSLRRLAQAATPGPWEFWHGMIATDIDNDGGVVIANRPTPSGGKLQARVDTNFQYIVAANPAAITELLDRLEAAEEERDALRAKIEAMEKQEPVAHYKDAPHTIYLQTGCDDPEDCECSFNEWGDTRITRLNDC